MEVLWERKSIAHRIDATLCVRKEAAGATEGYFSYVA